VVLTEHGLDRVFIRCGQLVVVNVVRLRVVRHHHEVEVERSREEDAERLQPCNPTLVVNDDSVVGVPCGNAVDFFLRQVVAVDVGVVQQLPGGVLDATPSALMARDIQVQKADMGDAEPVQETLEVIDVSATERRDRNGCVIGEDASGFKQP